MFQRASDVPVIRSMSDMEIRAHGYVIAERPAHGQPKWRHVQTGRVYVQSAVVMRVEKTLVRGKRGTLDPIPVG